MLVKQSRPQVIVTVSEDRRGNRHCIPDDPAHRMSPAVHHGLNLFDDDAASTFNRLHLDQLSYNLLDSAPGFRAVSRP